MEPDVGKWLRTDGEVFFRDLGIKEGQVVLDFGCGEGHYTIPAAKIVGNAGRVYALDKDKWALTQLMERAKSEGLAHIVPVDTSGELAIILKHGSVETVLLYDILHYMSSDQRSILYHEVYRILGNDGMLLVYPKHHKSDQPLWNLRDMSLGEVIEEIEDAGFYLEKRFLKNLLHNESYTQGIVLRFRRAVTGSRTARRSKGNHPTLGRIERTK